MTRFILLIFLCFFGIKTYSQKYFIPFVENNKIGLVNEKGKTIIPNKYDDMRWYEHNFFLAETEAYVTDTLQINNHFYIRKNERTIRHTIIHKGKIVIDNLPHTRYEFLLDKLIIAQFESVQNAFTEQIKRFKLPQQECISLFNTKGESVYPEHFYKIQKIDTSSVIHKNTEKTKYILFVGINLQRKYSLFAYDLEAEKISHWFIQNAEKIHFKDADYTTKSIVFEVTDENYVMSYKKFEYQNSDFKLTDAVADHLSEYSRDYPDERHVNVTSGSGYFVGEGDMTSRTAKPDIQKDMTATKPKELFPIFRMINDSVYFYPDRSNSKEKTPIAFNQNQKAISRTSNYYTFVIFQEDTKFKLINLEKSVSKAYDSLFYFNNNLVAKHNGKFGIIDAKETVLLPFEYDKLVFELPKIDLQHTQNGNYALQLKTPTNYSKNKPNRFEISSKDYIQVFKNGNVGLWTLTFEEILPTQYDYIAKNGMYFTNPRQETQFILKRDNKYICTNSLNAKSLQETNITFDFIPLYYYKNYYGVNGFDVYGLYDDEYRFKGFVSKDGKKFYN